MLYKSKSNHSLIKSKDLSLLHLTTLSNFLEGEQGVTQDITKEIKNQIAMSRKNELIIDKSMSKINSRAEEIVRRLEQEKEKNEKLQFLVKHIEQQIYNAKLDKSLQLKNSSSETDKLDECSNLLKARERDLQKICQKTNGSSYELSKKLDVIRALRSERTIVSELLDKIERELCSLQHCYKVLVIERTKQDHHCMEKLEDFRKLEHSAHKEMGRAASLIQKDCRQEKEEEYKLAVHPTPSPSPPNRHSYSTLPPFIQNQLIQRQPSQQEVGKDKQRQKEKKAKIQGDILKLEREKTVKIILNSLGISSPKQLPESVEYLDYSNEQALNQLSKLEGEIQSVQAAICRLGQRRQKDSSKKSQTGVNKKIGHSKKEETKKNIEEIRQNRLELQEFKEVGKILYQSIKEAIGGEPEQRQFFNDEQEVKFYMGFLEQFFERSYLQDKAPKHCTKDGNASKRLTSLLNSHMLERNHMSIYEEHDLLEFAKKNLERIEKSSR